MRTVGVFDAKTHLSSLIEAVERGESITITKHGRPVARLVPYARRTEPRAPGVWRGQVRIAPDFDAPDDDLIGAFER